MLFRLAIYFGVFASFVLAQMSPEKYSHSATLRSGDIKLYWKFDETHITIEVMGRTTGWLGIGFSQNGAMKGSDIIIGWVKNGDVTITDRHGTGNVVPTLDNEQNINVLGGAESNGWTMYKFSRQLAACEDLYDREITDATQRLIYAFGTSDPTGEDIVVENYHGSTNRGVESVFFLEPVGAQHGLPNGPTYETFDILANNFEIPAEETYYNCRMYKMPELTKKHHIVKFEPVVSKGNEKFVHHMIMYQCGDVIKNKTELELDARCYTPNMQAFQECTTLIAIWGIGGVEAIYPEEAGMSIGGPGDAVYIQMEVHYDNLLKQTGIRDNSGLRFTYTSTIRRHDIGVLNVGAFVNGLEHLIPPRSSNFESVSYCTAECLNKGLNRDGIEEIKMLGVILHSHVAGRQLRLRHIRNGKELPHVASDSNYDFNYQYMRFLDPFVVLKKNDTLQMECVYDTSNKDVITQGGLGTKEEMCMSFIYYYPKMNLPFCYSSVSSTAIYPFLGIEAVDIQRIGGEHYPLDLSRYQIKASGNHTGKTLYQYLNNDYTWTADSEKKFEKFYKGAQHYQLCIPRNKRQLEILHFTPVSIESSYVEQPKQCVQTTGGGLGNHVSVWWMLVLLICVLILG